MQTLILNHYPPVIKQIKEMQQIAKAEDIEFSKLNTKIKEVIRNMFVFTADENGIQRFEKMIGIASSSVQSLEERRLCILAKICQGKISLRQLQKMLQEYSQGIRLISHIDDGELEVVMAGDTINKDIIYKIVDEVLPLNIWFDVSRELNMKLYMCLEFTTEMYVDIGWEG